MTAAGAPRPGALILAAGGVVFALLATLNTGGYRYGVGDQAAYIPQILRAIDGRFFPRDAALLGGQSRMFLFDKLLAATTSVVPASLETWFLVLYVATLVLLYAGLLRLGSRLLVSGWALAAFVLAETLRHRITRTGANTLEGYFHPRQLAFAIGVLGLGEMLRGRPWLAIAAAVLSGLVHPTTGLWFVGWIGVALFVERPRLRIALGAAAGLGTVAAVALIARGFAPSIGWTTPGWRRSQARTTCSPTSGMRGRGWPNLLYPVVIGATFAVRRARGLVRPGEAGLVVGCLALVAVFLATLPLIAGRVALLVQLQVSRVFWMADLLATVYVIWWLVDSRRAAAPRRRRRDRGSRPALVRWPRWRCSPPCAASTCCCVEHPGRPLFAAVGCRPMPGPTSRVPALQGHTPLGTHVLADPNHAWRFGTSLRVVAARDVFLENVKDEAMSMYNRRMAQRLAERRLALGDFEPADAGRPAGVGSPASGSTS